MPPVVSPSSSPVLDHERTTTATLAIPSVAIAVATTASKSRRVPPPCWSSDETLVLIDAYREKWYSLNRGNLKANHWQEVADDVASRFRSVPAKTAVQCRHKMEKLRRRYRAEIQRSAANGRVRSFSSSWALFQSMHSLEKRSNYPSPPSSDDEDLDYDSSSVERTTGLYTKDRNFSNPGLVANGVTSAFRTKNFPKVNGKFHGTVHPNLDKPNPNLTNSNVTFHDLDSNELIRDGIYGVVEMGRRDSEISNKRRGNTSLIEVVEAMEALGEGFMRIERAKMDMACQLEVMRMEMELTRTRMILESQQRIVEAYAKRISGRPNKKSKNSSF